MKKIIALLSLLAIVMLGSCSSVGSKAEDVAKKVEAGQELSEEDFMVIVDYLNMALDDAEKTHKELGQLSATNRDQYKEAAKELQEKYPHLGVLGKALVNDPAAKNLSDADKEKAMSVLRRMATLPSILLWNKTV